MEDDPAAQADPPARLSGDDGEDRVVAALDFLRGVRPAGGDPYRETDTAGQKARLKEWAESLGCLLNPESILPQLRRGGQEHDYFLDPVSGRCFKVTRCGEYLERLRLQNLITPGLNRLEGILVEEDDLAICISQPRLELIDVTQAEIDDWFVTQGFQVITTAAYYRADDNLGIFDAHDKNVVRSSVDPDTLIPFDVIPVQPDGGFLDFIRETLAQGQTLAIVRTARTSSRVLSEG
jgi:hypothetical protein